MEPYGVTPDLAVLRCRNCRLEELGRVRFSSDTHGQEVVTVTVTRKKGTLWLARHRRPPGPFVVMAEKDRQLLIVNKRAGSRLVDQTVQNGTATVHMRCHGCRQPFDYGRARLVSMARQALTEGRSDVVLVPGENTGSPRSVISSSPSRGG